LILVGVTIPRVVFAQYRKAILVVGDRSNPRMRQKEEALKKYLIHYRQKSGNDSSTLPIFVYDFSHPRVRNYCEKALGIKSSDLLFLGIVTAKGRLPEKVHFKVVNPRNIEKNARLIIKKFSYKSATGMIRVVSDPPDAKIWLEKTYKGRTPVTIKGLSSGDYALTLVKAGYIKTRRNVFVREGKLVSVNVEMPSTMGNIAVRSKPPGAKVYIDNVYYGETPLRAKAITPGKHRILIKKDDLKWNGTVNIASGKITTISKTLSGGTVAVETPATTPTPPTPTPTETPRVEFTPPVAPATPGAGVKDAFIPRSETNAVFQVSVSNLEEVISIKDYYKPKPGYKFVIVYLQQQNISNEVQIYIGKFSLVDQRNRSYENLDKLSNFWLVVLRPGGIIMGYLVYEIPEESKPMNLVLHGMNMPPLSVGLK